MNEKFESNLKDIGSRLKTVRKDLKKTLRQVEAEVGVNISAISEMEKGAKRPHQFYLFYLADQHSININWILTGRGNMYSSVFPKQFNFGDDTSEIEEMIRLIELSDFVSFQILEKYRAIKNENPDFVKHLLSKKQDPV